MYVPISAITVGYIASRMANRNNQDASELREKLGLHEYFSWLLYVVTMVAAGCGAVYRSWNVHTVEMRA